jgi:hypothetical protein
VEYEGDALYLTDDVELHEHICPCGKVTQKSGWSAEVVVYDITRAYRATLSGTSCPECSNVAYDGCRDRIFNWSAATSTSYTGRLFTHAILNRYIAEYTSSATPFHAFVTETRRTYPEEGISFASQALFQSAFFAFINLQAWGYDFSCHLGCGPEPRDLVLDGLSLCLPRMNCRTLHTPTQVYADSPKVFVKWQATKFLHAKGHVVTGKLLKRYAGPLQRTDKLAEFQLLTDPEFAKLKAGLEAEDENLINLLSAHRG